MVIPRLGLIINPIAGIGGRVGLKGSDGLEIQNQARLLGAVPQSENRTIEALERIQPIREKLDLITCPGAMGESAAIKCDFEPIVIPITINEGLTTAKDTHDACKEMFHRKVDLILFAGGDGTARDVCQAVGLDLPVLGIPTGVKIHSGVFAINPKRAGDLAVAYLQKNIINLQELEVMDIDENAIRLGQVSAKLYGYLKVPYKRRLVQGLKAASTAGKHDTLYGIVSNFLQNWLEQDVFYIIGPGTTTQAIFKELHLPKTLIGIDVLKNKQLFASDVNEEQMLSILQDGPGKIVVTPIGGQGFLFGRGNQQISSNVLRRVGRENIIVISTRQKINALRGRPLLIDTGDYDVNLMLQGFTRVITGYKEQIVYPVAAN
jgi:predicted polyphosphate/ATP-dependent NAD kinase